MGIGYVVLVTRKHAFQVLRIGAPFGVAAVCLLLLLGKLEDGALAALPQQLAQLSFTQICVAALSTLISFWAVGRYDVVAHRALGTGITERRAQIAGTSAIALSQTLGFGVFTAAIARWRMLPDLRLTQALRVSAFVSVSFIMALAVICALAWLVFAMPGWVALPAVLILLLTPALVIACLLIPHLAFGRFQLRLPSLKTSAAIFGWTLIDTLAAAFALYALMPAGALTLDIVLPAYLLALGAGLMSGAPGGVGPFELALLSLCPPGSETQALAGAFAFRVLYYAVPAVIAGIMLARPLRAPTRQSPPTAAQAASVPRPAELGILRQNGGKIAIFPDAAAALWPMPQTLCMMFDPLAGTPSATLQHLARRARHQNRLPVMYKCSRRTALAARKAGWQVMHVANDAILTPAQFDLTSRACRDLRRKLRQGARAGVEIVTPSTLPIAAMARIDTQWQAEKGRARGGSMGRFCPDYLSHQHVVLAYHQGQLVAYISLHITAGEWCLDLMRHHSDVPHGTIQMLVVAAIEQAAAQGVERFSLASVPGDPRHSGAVLRRFLAIAAPLSKTAGLKRFKSGFAPRWEPKYAAAPGKWQLMLALFDITLAIQRPLALPNTNPPHKEDEECEVAHQLAP